MQNAQPGEEQLASPSSLDEGVRRGLEGAVFPLDRERLTWVARENDARAEVLSALSALPGGLLHSLEQVLGHLQVHIASGPSRGA